MSTNRKMQGGWVEPDRLPKGPTGRALCRWCKTNEVRGRRKTFCSQACVDEYLVRVDPQYARAKVRERDQGVCSACGLDTEWLRDVVERWIERDAWCYWHFSWRDCTGKYVRADDSEKTYGSERARRALDRIYREYLGNRRGWVSLNTEHLWEADHITPVVEGGGECGLENLRTLCRPCHRQATAELARRRAGLAARPNSPLQQLTLLELAALD